VVAGDEAVPAVLPAVPEAPGSDEDADGRPADGQDRAGADPHVPADTRIEDAAAVAGGGPAGAPGQQPAVPPPFPEVSSVDELFSSERFATTHLGGGVSDTWLVTDLETGHRFILKQSLQEGYDTDAPFDAINEVIASRFHQAVGHNWPRAQFVAPDAHDWVLMHHVNDFPDNGDLLDAGLDHVGEIRGADPSRVRTLAHRLQDPLEPLRILVADYVLDNTDRHNANWLVMSAGAPGQLKPVPIDNAYTLFGRGFFEGRTALSYLHERLGVPSLPNYLDGWNAPVAFQRLHRRAVQDGLVDPGRVRAEYDRLVDRWSAALDAVSLADIDRGHAFRALELIGRRIDDLRHRSATYLRFLNGDVP